MDSFHFGSYWNRQLTKSEYRIERDSHSAEVHIHNCTDPRTWSHVDFAVTITCTDGTKTAPIKVKDVPIINGYARPRRSFRFRLSGKTPRLATVNLRWEAHDLLYVPYSPYFQGKSVKKLPQVWQSHGINQLVAMGGVYVKSVLAGPVSRRMHTYVNVFEDPNHYWLIEAGPVGEPPVTGAWAKPLQWYSAGLRSVFRYYDKKEWDRVRAQLLTLTKRYKDARISYNWNGPNSNSFIEHLQHKIKFQCLWLVNDHGYTYWKHHNRPF